MSSRIVFTREIENNTPRQVADIYIMNPDGTNLSRLTTNPPDQEWDCSGPALSPDGSMIAFFSYLRRPGINLSDIYVMDASGANITRLTNGPGDNEDPAWSPTGDRIVFAGSDGSSKSALYFVNPDGTELHQLTNSRFSDYQPAWACSGGGIVFVRELSPYPDRMTELFVINADGTGERQLTSFGGIVFEPVWSPDGSRIAFSSSPLNSVSLDICSVDATSGGSLIRHTHGGAQHFAPCYSPDGAGIVMGSNRGGSPNKIYVLDIGPGSWLQLTSGAHDDGQPDWRG